MEPQPVWRKAYDLLKHTSQTLCNMVRNVPRHLGGSSKATIRRAGFASRWTLSRSECTEGLKAQPVFLEEPEFSSW